MTLEEAVEYLTEGIEAVDDGLRIDEGRFLMYHTYYRSDDLVTLSLWEEDEKRKQIGDSFVVTVKKDKE